MSATTLCEECFAEHDSRETYTSVPMGPCCQCGRMDDRTNGGLKSYLFPTDPRQDVLPIGHPQ